MVGDDKLDELVDYLSGFVSEERSERIENVLHQRTRFINIILEDLYQPHNASAVMRSCDAFGVQDLHVIENEHRFNPHSGIAMGAEKWLTVKRYFDENALERCLNALKKEKYLLVATTPNSKYPDISEIPIDHKISLMFGAELTGLSEEALNRADIICNVPMKGFTESFNISVSVAICLYELTNRLRETDINWSLTDHQKLELRFEWLKRSIKAGDQLVSRFLNQ